MTVTWLNNADVEDFLDVSVVGGDLEDSGRLALNARDVDRNHIVRYATPADVSVLFLHLEYLRPQSAAGRHTQAARVHSRRITRGSVIGVRFKSLSSYRRATEQ